jgi:hypothetical protein
VKQEGGREREVWLSLNSLVGKCGVQWQPSPQLSLPHLLDMNRLTVVPSDRPMLTARATIQPNGRAVFPLLPHDGDDLFEDQGALEDVEGVWVLIVDQHAINQDHPTTLELTATSTNNSGGREGGEGW